MSQDFDIHPFSSLFAACLEKLSVLCLYLALGARKNSDDE